MLRADTGTRLGAWCVEPLGVAGGNENPGPSEICIDAVSTGRGYWGTPGYRRNVAVSLLVRERSCTGYTAGLSTPMVRLMEAGLDRVRSSRPLSYLA